MFQIIPEASLMLQVALCSLGIVAITFVSMLVLCLKFSGVPYRSHTMEHKLKCLLYVLILWAIARIAYGVLKLAYPDTLQGN